MIPRRPLVFFALAAAAVGCRSRAAGGASSNEIVLGVISPLTGPNAAYGVSMRNGVDLALKEAGVKVRAIHLDDESRVDAAAELARRLVTEERVDAILGESSTAATLAIAPIAERAEIPLVSPSATEPGVTEQGAHVFRACFVDPAQAEAMAKFAASSLGLKRIAVLRDLGSDYSLSLANAFKEAWRRQGGQIAGDEGYQSEDSDDRGAIAKVAEEKPDAIYLPGYAEAIARIAGELRSQETGPRLLGADGFDSEALIRSSSAALEGTHFTSHFSPDAPEPDVVRFVAGYRREFNEAPDASAALGYDAARLILDAAGRARAERRDLTAALASTRGFRGVTGEITFDARRVVSKPVVILKIEHRARHYVTRL
jgi:branched-chain amino acid transport system substrate-binding protein